MDLEKKLGALFTAERAVRTLHAELLREPDLVAALEKEIDRASKEAREEQALRLVRIAELFGDAGGAVAVDRLIDILGGSEPEARVVAGEALQEIGFSRFKELALGVERALARLSASPSTPALLEIPYMLAEIPEPGVTSLLRRFLQLKDPEPVAAAIEALVEIGDPEAIALLEPLAKDKRAVSMDDVEEGGTITVGELADEAIDLLERASVDRKGARE